MVNWGNGQVGKSKILKIKTKKKIHDARLE